MDPLSITVSIIAILQLSTKVLASLNAVEDASKDRTQCAIQTSNLYNLLFSLRAWLETGDCEKSWFDAVRALAIKNGPLDQFKEALETLQTKMTDGGRIRWAGETLLWKFKREEIASILGRMERLKSLVEIALQMDHFKLSEAIKDDTNYVRTHVPAIQSGIEKIQQNQEYAEYLGVLDWISSSNYPAQQYDIIERRQEGTGQWFLDTPEMARWLTEAKATLFCPGNPGTGKTMMAAIVVDYLSNSTRNCLHGVAYVYCDYKAQGKQDASGILAAILKQLVQARPSAAEPVKRLYEQHAHMGTRPPLEEIFGTLQDVLKHYSTTHIIIDALDECQDSDGTRRTLLAKLRDLQAGQDIRLMATSRFIPVIEERFREAIKLEIQAKEEDLKRFVAGQIYRLPNCIQRRVELQDMVQEKIVEAVDGMFLLARLHTDSLLDKRTPKEVKFTLAKLSKGSAALDDAYKHALSRIEGQLESDHERAKKVLSWITFAKRPLTTTEICCALAVEPEDTELDPEAICDVEDLVSVCAGLVVVDQESSIVRLVHYTTQDYLERTNYAWNTAAPQQIATTCLTYLCFDSFKSGSCSTGEELELNPSNHEFLDYAAKHWGDHARAVEVEVCELACSFLLNHELLTCAAQVLLGPKSLHQYHKRSYHRITGLHYAAQFGLSRIAQELLSRLGEDATKSIHAIDGLRRSPLFLSATQGHHEMTRLLLDKGADPNAQSGHHGNALQAASYGGHEQVVRLLFDKGADPNVQGGVHGNALHAASQNGHEAVARLLLDKGADPNAQGGTHGNALQAASYGGYEQVVRLLLDKGAKPNTQGSTYGNALQAASRGRHEQIVRLLLGKGADPNAQGGYYGNALQAASYGGHEQIVRLLLDTGADPNVQGGIHSSILQAASYAGHEQIVRLLLDTGADPNAQGEGYGNALQAASYGGHEQIVGLLLDMGVGLNVQGGYYGNALQAASYGGHEQVVRLLLNKGADPNAQGGWYGNALQAASYGGYEQVVRLLLDKGADPNTQGGYYGNTLQAASTKGHEHLVRLLLDKGADAKSQGGVYGTALQAASYGGHEQVVRLLLGKGANPNAQGGWYGNGLQAASTEGHEQAVRLLLDQGADPNTQGGYYGNALQAASYGGHEQVVRLLLNKGAGPNTQGGVYGNALQAASEAGHEAVIKLLLNKGADPNAQDERYGNALHAASETGHKALVRLLLDKGANPNAQGGMYGNALYAASTGGHKQVVRLLLDKGADPNTQGGHYRYPLQAASDGGYEQVVRLLLDRGADPNAQGGYYDNALQEDSTGGHEQMASARAL